MKEIITEREFCQDLTERLKQSESEDLERQIKTGKFRNPNSDWNEDDPEELIDFPCSDSFLNYYYTRGMTPRHGGDFRGFGARKPYYVKGKEVRLKRKGTQI